MFYLINLASWLGCALTVLLVVQLATLILIGWGAAVVALTARDDKRADRALEVFRILWSSHRNR